ncbi:hypothetical protein [Desulforamulus aquiferis]|uniref:Uncharacterized protein n=1 Tax=Desulforamulus aquiferis TaxID=1397668 RepID=A0AAW7ZEV0_9FIRM|nr:hypothetical protein [Desulforamulus aquiferis]MDO7787521.1 hypothetical protein [Desulforamulus aquiferis]RYD01644.1 hypothetical protein N752_29135 [Desulforamulus aquiferis]
MLYYMWVQHDLRPGVFWQLPRGEQLLLLAFSDIELVQREKARREVANK